MSAGKAGAVKVLKYTVVRTHPDTFISTALLAGQPVPDWAEDLVQDEDLTDGAGPAPAGDETEGYNDYTVAELKAEIDKRNEVRPEDQQLSKDGNKSDLVTVLEADDAATSG